MTNTLANSGMVKGTDRALTLKVMVEFLKASGRVVSLLETNIPAVQKLARECVMKNYKGC